MVVHWKSIWELGKKEEYKMKKLLALVLCVCLSGCAFVNDNSKEEDTSKKKDSNKVEDNKKVEEDVKVSFMGIGDNLIHMPITVEADAAAGTMNDHKYDYKGMFANIKKDIADADLAFINQETILGGYKLGLSGYPQFNSPSDIAYNLKDLGFDIVNTATNHSLDRYQDGINNSSAVWAKQKGVITAGTYTSQKDRDTIRTIKRKGLTFSFLAYTYGTNGIPAPNSYSVAYFNEAKIRKDVAKARKLSDVIIVSAHWGDENTQTPSAFEKKYAKLFADLGVDIVVGTHPHVIQPVEYVTGEKGNKMPVVYSLGNSLSGMLAVDNVLSGMIKFDFVKSGKTGKISVKNLKWQPLVTHYSGDAFNIGNTRKNFGVYKLQDYTNELAAQHGLNGYQGQSVTVRDLYERTETIVKKIPIVR